MRERCAVRLQAFEDPLSDVRQRDLRRGFTQRPPVVGPFAQEQRDRRGADHLCRAAREPRPANLASQAQHVEHRGLVPLEPRRQDIALPRACGQLEAIELREDGPQALWPREPARGLHVLPREQEAHELGRADRRDLGAQPVQRVAMNAREEPPVAPFEHTDTRRERAAQDDALGFEREQRCVDVCLEEFRRCRRASAVVGPTIASGRAAARRSPLPASRFCAARDAGGVTIGSSERAG